MDSKLVLCSGMKIDKNYTNVLSYDTDGMLALIEAKKVFQQNDYNYIDYTKNEIMANVDYSVAISCNYIAFQNPRHGNKWYFAFIDDLKYKAPNQTLITFTIDVWSTFFSDWQRSRCFVVREHVNNDAIGLHTLNEDLSCNNYIKIGTQTDIEYIDTSYIAICSTYDPSTGKDFPGVAQYNKNVFGYEIYLTPNNSNGIIELDKFLLKMASVSKIQSIQNMYVIPKALIRNITLDPVNFTIPAGTPGQQDINGTVYKLHSYSDVAKRFRTEVNDISNYQVKNNKCKCYPYRYLEVNNNNGNSNIFKIEFFQKNENDKIEFWNELAFSPGVSGRVVPWGYKCSSLSFDPDYNNMLELGKFPNCGWSCDEYINWLTQNAVNVPTSFVGLASNTTSSLQSTKSEKSSFSGSEISSAFNVAGNIAGLIGQFYSASLLPNISHGGNCGDVSFSTNTNRFDYNTYRLCDEELKQIDDYFTRFGYKINETKLPNITGRRYWNFLEIGKDECIGYGTVPSKYMEEINNICRQGVTIWHEHDSIGNFNLTNSIV